jgi:hypothetical protein
MKMDYNITERRRKVANRTIYGKIDRWKFPLDRG